MIERLHIMTAKNDMTVELISDKFKITISEDEIIYIDQSQANLLIEYLQKSLNKV